MPRQAAGFKHHGVKNTAQEIICYCFKKNTVLLYLKIKSAEKPPERARPQIGIYNMKTVFKVLALAGAVWLIFYDISHIGMIFEAPYFMDSIISYYYLPVGIIFALSALIVLACKKAEKPLMVVVMVFSGLHFILKAIEVVWNLCAGMVQPGEMLFQTLLWCSQALLLAAIFLYALRAFVPQVNVAAGIVFFVAALAHLGSYIYFVSFAGGGITGIFESDSSTSFILPQFLTVLGYTFIFFDSVWVEKDVI